MIPLNDIFQFFQLNVPKYSEQFSTNFNKITPSSNYLLPELQIISRITSAERLDQFVKCTQKFLLLFNKFELFKKSVEQKRWMGAQCKVTDRVGSWYWAVERCCLDGRLWLAKYLEKKWPTPPQE